MPNNFQNETFSTPLQELEVHSQETIRMEHRERSGTGRAAINSKGRSNSNESSDGVLTCKKVRYIFHYTQHSTDCSTLNCAVVTMESLESERQWAVPPDFQNKNQSIPSSKILTSGNLQLEQQGPENRSPKQFERQDSGDESVNELDLAEEELSNSQWHLNRVENEGKSFCK